MNPAEPVAQAPGFEGATTGAAPQSRAERQADALFAALDTDQDGSITKDEFTEGAAALLRRARGGHHYRRAHGEQGEDHESRGAGRLERKLGRVFDRVDADDDGGVTKDELVAALSGGRDGSAPADATPPATAQASTSAAAPAPVPSPAPAALGTTTISVSFVSVTFVSFAVQSYNTVGQLAPPPAPAAESQPLEQPSA